jgi:hypothetical protein
VAFAVGSYPHSCPFATVVKCLSLHLHCPVSHLGAAPAAACLLREKETRKLVVLDHIVEPNVMGFLRRMAGEMDHASTVEAEGVVVPTLPAEELATAAGATERVLERQNADPCGLTGSSPPAQNAESPSLGETSGLDPCVATTYEQSHVCSGRFRVNFQPQERYSARSCCRRGVEGHPTAGD